MKFDFFLKSSNKDSNICFVRLRNGETIGNNPLFDELNRAPYNYIMAIQPFTLMNDFNHANFSFSLHRTDTGECLQQGITCTPRTCKDERFLHFQLYFQENSNNLFGKNFMNTKFFILKVHFKNDLVFTSGNIKLISRRRKERNVFDQKNYNLPPSKVVKRMYNKRAPLNNESEAPASKNSSPRSSDEEVEHHLDEESLDEQTAMLTELYLNQEMFK